jgi:antitoxin HicB
MNISYPCTIEADDDGFLFVQFLDVEEAFTQGETIEEALFNAEEVLSAMLAYRLAHNQEVPEPSPCPAKGYTLTPKPEVLAVLQLKDARGGNMPARLSNVI